ncbi:MAG: DUF2807 domain-containing protein [Cyclobacteriaceae bacterium]|nr:DUF2807 domain-containing protein [Cyclobacteriaceae bacterium]
MKTLKTTAIGLLVGFVLTSCLNSTTVHPSKNVTTLSKSVSGYEGLEISSAFTVDVQYSSTDESIEIEANENLHQYIEVEKVNNLLRIRIKSGININGNSTLKAHIVTNNMLDYFSASGASRITLSDPVSADQVTLSLSGASQFNGSITANSLDGQISGASNVNFEGNVESLDLNVSGASTVSDYDMIIQDAVIQLSGASQVSLTINKTLDISASGASVLRYKGKAAITDIDVSSSSQVIKVD